MRHFQYAVLSTVVVIGLASIASAADMPAKRLIHRAPVPIFSWTGFYVGVNAGGHWGRDKVTTTTSVVNFSGAAAANIDAATPGTNSPSGFIGGLQAGYNWQVSNIVLGLEGDVNFLTGNSSRSFLFPGPAPAAGDLFTTKAKSNFLATVRGRLGVTFDRALLYATGGLAIGTIKTTDSITVTAGTVLETTSNSTSRAGWTVGGGLEYAFTNNWSAKIEYLYVDLGRFDTSIPCVVACAVSEPDIIVHHKWTDNIARAGLNYRF